MSDERFRLPGHGTVAPGDIRISDEIRDDVLLRQAAKGDEDAFTTLYRRHQAAIYRFALRMTGNAWASEEIVQDVFMTLMREPKKVRPGARSPRRLSVRHRPQSRHETSRTPPAGGSTR